MGTSSHRCVTLGIAQNLGCVVTLHAGATPGLTLLPSQHFQAFPGHTSSRETSSAQAGNAKFPHPGNKQGICRWIKPLTQESTDLLQLICSLFNLQISGIFHPNQLSSRLPLRGQSPAAPAASSAPGFLVSLKALVAPFGGLLTHGAAGTFQGMKLGFPSHPSDATEGHSANPRVPSTVQSELSSSFSVSRATDELSLH